MTTIDPRHIDALYDLAQDVALGTSEYDDLSADASALLARIDSSRVPVSYDLQADDVLEETMGMSREAADKLYREGYIDRRDPFVVHQYEVAPGHDHGDVIERLQDIHDQEEGP